MKLGVSFFAVILNKMLDKSNALVIEVIFASLQGGYSYAQASGTNQSYFVSAHPKYHQLSRTLFQKTTTRFRQKFVDLGMTQSMSRVGRCLDNAPMEGWWGILKSEMYYLKKFTTRKSLVSVIENYKLCFHFSLRTMMQDWDRFPTSVWFRPILWLQPSNCMFRLR